MHSKYSDTQGKPKMRELQGFPKISDELQGTLRNAQQCSRMHSKCSEILITLAHRVKKRYVRLPLLNDKRNRGAMKNEHL